jgi:hypothetical protein
MEIKEKGKKRVASFIIFFISLNLHHALDPCSLVVVLIPDNCFMRVPKNPVQKHEMVHKHYC